MCQIYMYREYNLKQRKQTYIFETVTQNVSFIVLEFAM